MNDQENVTVFDEDLNIKLFQELLTCGDKVYSWVYANDGHLAQTNCPDLVMDLIFSNIGCKDYMLSYSEQDSRPLVLGGPLGLTWCAVFRRNEEQLKRMWVIGPVSNTEITQKEMENSLINYDIPLSYKPQLIRLLVNLPVVSTVILFRYALMMHYCITGEKLERSDIQFQESEIISVRNRPPRVNMKNRNKTYRAEQQLLNMVREGDLNYKNALGQARWVSYGVRVNTGDPLHQAIISCTVFASLCTRAAIEGGLSPEAAYSLGDNYIQAMSSCRTVPELTNISNEMYEDFILRVHKQRTDPKPSPQIQSCCDFINLHLEEKLSLHELANRIGYTDYYLSRKFKQEIGVSISEYVKRARVERARLLLTTTDEAISEIARRLQFCSSGYFAEAFRKVTGMSPQSYRDGNQKM